MSRDTRPTVQLWRERFLALRLAGLEQDAPRPGRIPGISASKARAVVEATLHTKPPAATHWSVRTMARAQGISRMAVQRIWKQHNLKPHLVKTFKISRDKHRGGPAFSDKESGGVKWRNCSSVTAIMPTQRSSSDHETLS